MVFSLEEVNEPIVKLVQLSFSEYRICNRLFWISTSPLITLAGLSVLNHGDVRLQSAVATMTRFDNLLRRLVYKLHPNLHSVCRH